MKLFKNVLSVACWTPIVFGFMSHGVVFAQAPENGLAIEKTSPAESASRTEDKASAAFSKALLAINTMSGEFQQRILDSEGELLQLTEGEFKIKRPGYFYWKVAPPYEQIVIGTPESLKIYDPDLEQLSVHNQNSLAGTPASLMSGDVALISQDYMVSQTSSAAAEKFELRQKDSELSAFETLSFSFVKKAEAWLLSEMVFVDKLGQRTTVGMTNLKTNVALNADVFKFEPPAGTDVIVDG